MSEILIIRDGKEQDIPTEAQRNVDKYISTCRLIDSYLLEIQELSNIKKSLKKKLYSEFKIRFKSERNENPY
jgi:hypothetical protein